MNLKENLLPEKLAAGTSVRRSDVLGCDMVFAVYLPPQAEQGAKLPVLYWLSTDLHRQASCKRPAPSLMAAELADHRGPGRSPINRCAG